MISPQAFKEKLKACRQGALPLLTLDEFFMDNADEYAIAPNQWEFGRPHIAEMYEDFKALEQLTHVAWVRVALHMDTRIYCQDGRDVLELLGESIVICTTAGPEEIESIVNYEWLHSDGVIKTKSSHLNKIFSEVPEVPAGYSCMEIVWD